jgi:starch-binding outer membrane protein, SusD/RagB family
MAMKTKILLIIIPLVAFTISCNEDRFFKVEAPVNSIQTVEDLNRMVVGAYYNLTGNEGNRSIFDALAVFENALSDGSAYLFNGGNFSGVFDLYSRNNDSDIGLTNNTWGTSYQVIQQANLGIGVIESGRLDALAGNEKLSYLKGELLFLRAYSYWVLLKLFCPAYEAGGLNDTRVIPYNFETVTGFQNANFPAGETGRIYDNVVADLAQAKELLNLDPADNGRVNKFAAAALLARVHFQMGNYTQAADECTYVMDQNAGRYNLNEAPIEAWNKDWNKRGAETIWAYVLGDAPAKNGLGGSTTNWKVPRRYSIFNWSLASNVTTEPGNGLNGAVNRTTDRSLAISKHMLTRVGWIAADSTPSQNARQDKRFQQVYKYVSGKDPIFPTLPRRLYYANKYYRGLQSASRIGPVPLIRLAEMYLTRAIIRFKAGDTAGAAADLNVVRQRAWDATVAGKAYTPLTGADVTEELIHQERWKELSHEADWLFYLQALGMNIPNGDRGQGEIPYNSYDLFWPIPLSERQLNQVLNQKL